MLKLSELKSLLRREKLRLSKRRGQHHLIDARLIERIVDRCALTPDDLVVEIGAGLGALTEPLAKRAGRVIAVESDRRIAALLVDRMRPLTNVAVVCQDILTFDWARSQGAVVVGAVPYHITSPLIVSLCDHHPHIREAWLLVQREVADRMASGPGSKVYGRLSVLCQSRWRVSREMSVAPGAFFPRPAVASTWVRLRRLTSPVITRVEERMFFEVVKAAFAQRRKTLCNGLMHAGLATRPQAEQLLRRLGLPLAVRGEALSIERLIELSRCMKSLR